MCLYFIYMYMYIRIDFQMSFIMLIIPNMQIFFPTSILVKEVISGLNNETEAPGWPSFSFSFCFSVFLFSSVPGSVHVDTAFKSSNGSLRKMPNEGDNAFKVMWH